MTESIAALEIETPRRPAVRRRRSNRRVSIQGRAAVVTVANGLGALGRLLLAIARVLAKLLLLCGLTAGVVAGGYLAGAHVMASPRFALRAIDISETTQITRDDVLALAAVQEGDRLLALDTDAIAARIADHPWVSEARVSRQLPSGLRIEVTERAAAAAVALGALYLVDDAGRPFKRATMAELDGLPIITGLERPQYVDHRLAGEAAFREALSIMKAWSGKAGRPPLSEVNLHPRHGFTLFLLEGGAEIRLGRGDYDRKLARLDQIFEAVTTSGAEIGSVRVVHLDGANNRIPVRLQVPSESATATALSE